ncbi:MAG: hypothetical protein MI799_18110 [Desulfobacterales bacterium]|nr:hypothetical protein [Desulfobacterales bacterium]
MGFHGNLADNTFLNIRFIKKCFEHLSISNKLDKKKTNWSRKGVDVMFFGRNQKEQGKNFPMAVEALLKFLPVKKKNLPKSPMPSDNTDRD